MTLGSSSLMPNTLALKLEHFTRLSREDKDSLGRMAALRTRRFQAREDIIRQGDRPASVNLLLSGWACRYKMLEDGRRQVTAYFVPGDICDLKIFLFKHMDHSIAAITQAEVAQIPVDVMEGLTEHRSRLARALWWCSLVNEAVEREWIVNLGRRDASERLAHLCCELFHRLRCVGLTNGNSFHLPLTQAELAEALGISPVHVNRSLQELRADGLIRLEARTLSIPDLARLEQAALFNPDYLHLTRDGAEYDANDF